MAEPVDQHQSLPGLAPYYKLNTQDKRKPRSWQWKEATDAYAQRRQDGVKFKRWLPATTTGAQNDEYLGTLGEPLDPIAEPIPTKIPEDDKNGWTKEELQSLIDLGERFDYRWPIIADRWPHEHRRTTIDLREKFYSIATLDEPSFTYDAENERLRFAELHAQFKRSTESEAKEAQLMEQLAALDKKILKWTSTTPSGITTKLELAMAEPEDAITLRSRRLDSRPHPALGLGHQLNSKLNEMLLLLEVPSQPLPTKGVCDSFDELRRDTVRLFALKRQLKKKRQQLATALAMVKPDPIIDKQNETSSSSASLLMPIPVEPPISSPKEQTPVSSPLPAEPPVPAATENKRRGAQGTGSTSKRQRQS